MVAVAVVDHITMGTAGWVRWVVVEWEVHKVRRVTRWGSARWTAKPWADSTG